jgi:hypothetical protein
MYSIRGLSLDNPAAGWELNAKTQTLTDLERELAAVRSPARDGVIPSAGPWSAPIWPLVMRVERRSQAALHALITGGNELTQGGFSIGYSFAGLSVLEDHLIAGYAIIAYSLRLDGVFWRGAARTTAATALAAASVPIQCFTEEGGLSAPVGDALVRVKGAVTGLQVTDSSGAWFTYTGPVIASQWLRFESATGRAFLTTTDTWTGGTEVSGAVDFGGPRGTFEIAPSWTTSPAERAGALTVATASRTSASVQVRGRAAYLI